MDLEWKPVKHPMPDHLAPTSIVVGVDGSRSAVRAALWAVEEAVSRDIPLRLIAVIEPAGPESVDPQRQSRDLASAELAVHYAYSAIESTERPVKLETDIVHGPPVATLLAASRSAAMLCIGAIGTRHLDPNHVGSTAKALVASAHCPVAIVRGRDRTPPSHGWVVVELDESPESAAVLACGVEEARLRGAPLRVLGAWQSSHTEVHDSSHDTGAVADDNRVVHIHLDHRLSPWLHRYPDLDIRPIAVHGSSLNYLTKHAKSIQLVVVGARDTEAVQGILGPIGAAALQDAECSVLVLDHQRLL